MPISSGVGTYSWAPKNRGVKTGNKQRSMIEIEVCSEALTVSLDWIVSNTAEHREPRMFANLETFPHPWKEVGQRIVPAPDTFGNTGTSARE